MAFAKDDGKQMNNIFVGNLGLDATEQDIRCVFEKYGTVERFRIMTDRQTGQPRGFAFVEMADDADGRLRQRISAQNARQNEDEKRLHANYYKHR